MLARIKTVALFLQRLFLFLLVSGVYSSGLAAEVVSEGADFYKAELSVPGVSIKVPLDLQALGSTVVTQLAVSFALLLPVNALQNTGLPLKQTTCFILQAFRVANRLYLYNVFQQWLSGLLFPDLWWTPAAIPGATSEADTTNPRLGHQTQIETRPYYRLQRDNFGTLHSLVAYAAEMTKQLSPGQAMVTSDDRKAELRLLQQDTTGTTYSITLPGLDNTTSTYEVDSHSGVYRIKRFDGMNIERYQKIAWSEPEEGSTTTDLTIQFVSPVKYRESGIPIELTIPQWLSHRLLAASSAMALADFNRLFIGWYRSVFLASDPGLRTLFKALSPGRPEEAGSEIQKAIILASSSGCLYCHDENRIPVYSPHSVPESYVRKAPDSQSQASGSGAENKRFDKGSLKPKTYRSNRKTLKFKRNKDNDDKKPPSLTYDRPLNHDAALKSLLEQATEVFFLNRGMSGQALSAPLLPDVKKLIYSLSSAGMLQIFPVEDVAIDQWPMVASRRLFRYINSFCSATGQSVDPEADGENGYVVKMTQEMFNNMIEHFGNTMELAQAANKLQDDLKRIISDFCYETKTASCYYGGFSVGNYLKDNILDHEQWLHYGNLPVTEDIDVLFSLASERVDDFKWFMEKELKKSGFEISDFEKDKLLFTFPARENKELPYILSTFRFKGEGKWEELNDYFPNLDIAMSKSGEQVAFLTDAQVVAESVKRGLHFEASKRGAITLTRQGKHWDRIFLLNTVFPKNTVFSMLMENISLNAKSGEMAEEINKMSEEIKKNHFDNKYLSKELLRLSINSDSLISSSNYFKGLSLKQSKHIDLNRKVIDGLQIENQELNNKIRDLTKSMQEGRKESAISYSEKEQLDSEIKKLTNIIEESKKETENAYSEKETLNSEVERLMQLIPVLDEERSKLHIENKNLNYKVVELNRIHEDCLKQIATIEYKNKKINSELNKLQQEIFRREQQKIAQNNKVKTLKESLRKNPVDASVQEIKYKVKELEKESRLFCRKENNMRREFEFLKKTRDDLDKENRSLKKHIEDSKRRELLNKASASSREPENKSRARYRETAINTKPEDSQWYEWFIHNALDYKLELILGASTAAITGYKLASFWRRTHDHCRKISQYGFRQLCLDPVNDDSLSWDILKLMGNLPDEYRIIEYRLFSVNLDKGTMIPVKRKTASNIKEEKEELKEYHYFMAHFRHYPLWQMTAQQLLQIKEGISSVWKSKGKAGTFYRAVRGIIDYCGLMPDSIWQEECSREALKILYENRPLTESVIFNGKDIKPDAKSWVIAFLPVWGLTNSGELTWHDVWPYRLNRKGYTILGSAKLDKPFPYKCTDDSIEKHESIFTRLKWIDINPDLCDEGDILYITRSKNSVFWSRSRYRDDKHYVESNNDRKTFYGGAWEYNTSPHNSWRLF